MNTTKTNHISIKNQSILFLFAECVTHKQSNERTDGQDKRTDCKFITIYAQIRLKGPTRTYFLVPKLKSQPPRRPVCKKSQQNQNSPSLG